MLSFVSLGRAAWAKLQAAHPVIRWGGAILVALVVLELIAQETISLYVHTQTARAQIEQANELAQKAAAERREAEARAAVARDVAAGERAKADAASGSFVNSPFMRPFMEPEKASPQKMSCADYRLGAAAMGGMSTEQWRAKVDQAERDGECVAGPKRSRAKLRAEYKKFYSELYSSQGYREVHGSAEIPDADKEAEDTANRICDDPRIVGYSAAGCDP
jgi:hypothetical protein